MADHTSMDKRAAGTDRAETIGFCTSIFGHRDALTPQKIADLARWQVGCIEIAALQDQHVGLWDRAVVDELVAAAKRAGLRVWSLHAPFCGLAMDDADTRAAGVRRLMKAIAVARRFGATCVVVHPGRDVPIRQPKREMKWMLDGLRAAAETLPRGMKLALEVMGPNSLGGTLAEMQRALAQLDATRFGVCFDTGHAHTHPGDVRDFIRGLAGRIVTVHLHDNYGDKDAHAMPGQGNLDWPAVLRALREAGYAGPWMSEAGAPGQSPRWLVREFTRLMRGYERRM